MPNRTRLSVVRFLNTTPLVYALQQGSITHDFDMTYDVPAVCAQKLQRGETDLGVIPSIEYARSEVPYRIVPDASISSRGPVQSILLFHTVPFHRITSVALDTSSRTSVALTHIILKDKYGINFTAIGHPPVLDEMLAVADAALVIGDPALEYTNRPEARKDLGKEWTELTKLPFVYAFWAGKAQAINAAEVEILIRAKEAGLNALQEIATAYASTHVHPREFYLSYLCDHLKYPLGPDECAGLMEFYRRAHRLGLINAVPELWFYERIGER